MPEMNEKSYSFLHALRKLSTSRRCKVHLVWFSEAQKKTGPKESHATATSAAHAHKCLARESNPHF